MVHTSYPGFHQGFLSLSFELGLIPNHVEIVGKGYSDNFRRGDCGDSGDSYFILYYIYQIDFLNL